MSFFRSSGECCKKAVRLCEVETVRGSPWPSSLFQFRQHGGFRVFQHAIETAQNRERQDDLAVFGLLVVAAQEISDGPDKEERLGSLMYGQAEGWKVAHSFTLL